MSATEEGPGGATRILVVEDDQDMQELLRVVLADPGREILVTGTGHEAEEVLQHSDFDLILLDLMLPDCDGRGLLSRLREKRKTAAVPVICVSARMGPEIRADCFTRGADSYVEKPFDPDLLRSDVARRLQRQAARVREAHRDDVTGLLNRAGFLGAMEDLSQGPYSVVAFELDGFQRIGDRWGWGTGDRVLTDIADALAHALHDIGVLARWGAGKFALAFAGDLALDAEKHTAALVDTIQRLPIAGPDGETFRVTASAGIFLAGAGHSPMDAFERAQARLFVARESGGHRSIVEDENDHGTPRLVLLAEDDQIAGTILTHRLEKEGFRVVWHRDGRDAYDGALHEIPSLVILDVRMPGMDGFEVLDRLRRTPAYLRVPIVMLTSLGNESDVVRAFELGADDYVLKPFSPAELIARARRLIARGHVSDPE